MGSWRCSFLLWCMSGSTGLVGGRGKEGSWPLAPAWARERRAGLLSGPGALSHLVSECPLLSDLLGSRVRDGRLCGHCQAPGAKAGLDLPSSGLPPKFPATPMPTASRSGSARRGDWIGAGGTCRLGLVETVTCRRSGTVLGLSHTFVGWRFSTSAMSLKLWPGASFCRRCHSPLPPYCPHLGAHGSAPKLDLTNVTQLAQSLLCRRGRPPRGGNHS